VPDGWCWFVLREVYCWLVAGGWFVVREKYYWLVAKTVSSNHADPHLHISSFEQKRETKGAAGFRQFPATPAASSLVVGSRGL
jgi:hypothetical protein